MGMESAEVQMARLQEQMNQVRETLDQIRIASNKADTRDEKMDDLLQRFDRRLENVEKQLASSAPTIEEFITIKHKVQGAGILGRWIWAGGGILVGIIFSFREQIREFLF